MRRYDLIMSPLVFWTVPQFGAAVREARTRADLTQQELADRAHVSRRWLGMFENGKNLGAELSKVMALVDALGMELSMKPHQPSRDAEAEAIFALYGELAE